MLGALIFKACSLMLLLVVVISSASVVLSSDVQLLVFKSAHSDFVLSSENNYGLKLAIDKSDYVAIKTIQQDKTKVLLDDKISKIIVCSQPTISRSYNFQNPLSTRARSGVTLMIELQLDKDESLALRSIQTLEKSKLEAIRLLIASNLRNILDIDAEHREGRAPSDSTVDLSKLAVVSDRTVLVPPYYSLEASTDLFDLQRNVTSLHLYLYLPKMEIELNREGIKLKSVLSSVELHEQCLAVTKSSRVLVETGAVAGVEHVLLNVPLASEAKLVECLNSIQCKHRTLQTTANHANEGEYNAVRPVVMTMKRSLNKTGFHRELVTQIRLSNANELVPDASKCSLVLAETLSEDYYIDRDEVEGLERFEGNNHFDFFTSGIDIERPAYTSTQHVVIVTSNNQIKSDPDATYTINFPIHLRYQMPSLTGNTHRETSINPPLVYLKCENTQQSASACKVPPRTDADLIAQFGSPARSACQGVTWIPVEVDHLLEPLEVSIPIGQLLQDRLVTLFTFGSTVLAVVIVAYFVYSTPSAKQKGE